MGNARETRNVQSTLEASSRASGGEVRVELTDDRGSSFEETVGIHGTRARLDAVDFSRLLLVAGRHGAIVTHYLCYY